MVSQKRFYILHRKVKGIVHRKMRFHFISIVFVLIILLTISNFATTCQLTLIRVLIDC